MCVVGASSRLVHIVDWYTVAPACVRTCSPWLPNQRCVHKSMNYRRRMRFTPHVLLPRVCRRHPTSVQLSFMRIARRTRVQSLVGALLLLWHFCRAFSVATPPIEQGLFGDTPWVSKRTVEFTRAWSSHRSRNAAVYVCLSTRKIALLKHLFFWLLVCPEVFYDGRHDDLFEVPTVCIRHRCLRRFGKSHYIYADFVLKTYDGIMNRSIEPPPPTEDGKIAVIVEPRRHPLLEYTIRQVMTTLGPSWSLQIFLSSKNERWIRQCLRIHEGGRGEHIEVTPLAQFGLDDMGQYGNRVQSAFSAHEHMYEAVRSEHILWFQVDVIMRAEPQPEWLQYAFIGSEWYGCEYPTCSQSTCNTICGGGNSGLSLRRRSKLYTVATRGHLPENLWGNDSKYISSKHTNQFTEHAYFDSDEFLDNSRTRWFEDDLQLSFKLSKLGLLPPGQIPRQFSVAQALPKYKSHSEVNPTGLHKPWSTPWIHPNVIIELLADPFDRIMLSGEIN